MTHQHRPPVDTPPHLSPQKSTADPSADRQASRGRRRRWAAILRGLTWSGAALLLGTCSLPLSTAPLGAALLAASSSYTWYILAGLLLSAVAAPVSLTGWTWAGVYLLCVILRLIIRFFVDPPTLSDGRPCRGGAYLRLCWDSFKNNVGLLPEEDACDDYYPGADLSVDKPAEGQPSETPDRVPPPFRPRLFWEHPLLRMLTAAVTGLTAGLFGVITGGFHVYDLLGALLMLILTPVATFLFVSCFGEAGMTLLFSPDPLGRAASRREDATSRETGRWTGGDAVAKRFHALPLCSVCFLLGCVVYAARPFSPALGSPYLIISLAPLLGLLLTLTAASRLGIVAGLAVGTVCGLAASPALSPVFILCAGGYALLAPVSHRAGAAGGCVAGGGWLWAVEGVMTLIPWLPALLLTPPLFFLTERLWAVMPSPAEDSREEEHDPSDISEIIATALSVEARSRVGQARTKALSEAFEALSKGFYSLSDRLKRPRIADLRSICDESFGRRCAHCVHREICWGAEYDRTVETQARITAQLHGSGRANARDLPDTLQTFCPHLEALVTDINARHARLTESLLRSEHTDVFAADYAAIAALLADALEEDRREARDFTCNRQSADAIYEYLAREGVTVQGVAVVGKESRRQRILVRGTDLDALAPRMEEVKEGLESICGVKLTEPVFEREERGVVMTLCAEALLTAEYAGSTVPAGHGSREPLPPPLTHETLEGEYLPPPVCGDHIAMFKTDNAYLYALISDGMGAGEEASLTSDICAMFLEKMLSAGNKVDVSLRMLDTYVRSKNRGTGEECSATVDLMELDLMDGQAVFAKNGAAPTYVVREGQVYKLNAPTMPIGILSELPRKKLRFRTHPGDVVVMVSDGVTLGNDECPWLIDLLSSPLQGSMDSLRADIIKRALAAGSEDDLSAIAIRVAE